MKNLLVEMAWGLPKALILTGVIVVFACFANHAQAYEAACDGASASDIMSAHRLDVGEALVVSHNARHASEEVCGQ